MTIEVFVRNNEEEGGRALEVVYVQVPRGGVGGKREMDADKNVIGPGGSRTYHVHLLRELCIREKDPD